MAKVVDLYALPVPAKHLETYRRLSRAVGRIFREHGVTDYREFTGAQPAMAGTKPFTGGIKLRKGEVLVAAIVGYPSTAARKRINAAIEKDPRLAKLGSDPSPFDMKRMTVSSFETIVEV